MRRGQFGYDLAVLTTEAIPAIFCILVAAIGWFYLFYSRAAHRLATFEQQGQNRVRIRLRRAGAVAMILLALAFAVGYYGVDDRHATRLFLVAWGAVLILLPTVLGIGLADLRLTRRLREQQRQRLS